MAIFKDGKEITTISKGSRIIAYVYKGAQLVWQAVRSCFGNGFWINDKPWINEDGWRNNK